MSKGLKMTMEMKYKCRSKYSYEMVKINVKIENFAKKNFYLKVIFANKFLCCLDYSTKFSNEL